jgi:hypothetical protein
MATATVTSFLPTGELDETQRLAVLAALAEKDATYKPIVAVDKALDEHGYPVRVSVEGGAVLDLVEVGTFGAAYASTVPPSANAVHDPAKAKDAKNLRLGPQPAVKMGWNWKITPTNLQAWSGKKRDISQAQVMGASAGDAAENAGFDRKEGEGWEWLHMIAHSMGGVEGHGPQVADNLVAGTSESNSQMIVTEEWMKDVITKSGGHAALWVAVEMFDAVRHIGKRIVYDFEIYNDKGGATQVYHVEFDPLSRRKPLAAINRAERYGGRERHPEGGVAKTKHTPRSKPTAHGPYVGADADPVTRGVEAAIEILKNEGVDKFHAFLEGDGKGIRREALMDVAELLSSSDVLAYLTALRKTSFGERAIPVVVDA